MAQGNFADGYPTKAQPVLPPESVLFGRSRGMQTLLQKAERVALVDVPVLIYGESGTGKEVLAKFIHQRSPRASAPFVKVNCPAIPAALLESELFGYEKGAFTGALGSKPGRVELAQGGTLFLDEISELELSLQAKLLQVLQDGKFCRIGGQEERHVDLRLLCATHQRLEDRIAAGAFREDLFYRINVVGLRVPPLRERLADIPAIVDYLLAAYNDRYNGKAKPLSRRILERFQAYSWPGNIRQLENLIKRYVVLGSEDAIWSELGPQPPSWPPEASRPGSIPLKGMAREAAREFERKVILEVLQAHHWNRKKAAQALNISYRSLLYKLRKATEPPAGNPAP